MKRKNINIGFFFFAMLLSIISIQAQEKKDSLVNVAFGTIAKDDLLGAVSTVSISDLMKKSYSTNTLDHLQSFVGGYTGNIWGQGALILVDGIPRSQWSVNPTQIESVTVLKGANSVALYGSKAAKGVVLITTKRGEKTPLTIDFRVNTGLYVPKAYPTYLNAAEYMNLYNEACRNDGISEKYGESLIYNTAAGTNRSRYPDIDFYTSDYLRKVYSKTDATAEISGGNDYARYYSNFGMSYNNSLLKYGEKSKDNDMSFNVRANVDVSITKWMTASTSAAVIIADSYMGNGNFWGSASTLRPNWFSPLVNIEMTDPSNTAIQSMVQNSNHLIDGKYLFGGTSTDQSNVFADMLAGGYSKNKNRTFQFNVGVAADLAMILNGLSFKTAYSVDYTDFYTEVWNEGYAVYEPTWSTMNGKDMITGLTKYNVDKPSINEVIGTTFYSQTMSFNAQFDYKRTFGQDHNVSGSLLGWGYQVQESRDSEHTDGASSYHRVSNANLGLQTAYNYRHKYYFDFTGAMVHSAKLPSKNRTAFSPSITLGWRISEEDFFKNNVSFVDNLKLTTSYANLNQDIDIAEFYMYKGNYDPRGGWYQWRDKGAGGWSVTSSVGGDNPNLSFIKRKEFRIGLETSLLDKLIDLDVNYFSQNTNGGLTQGSNTIYPSYFTGFLPYVNYNEDKRTGVDFTFNLNKKVGEVDASLGFSGMHISTEAVRRDESYRDAYQNRAGKALDSYWGYINEGFFQNQDEITNHATQTFGNVKPGDLKYKDVNADGVIDSKDQVDLGHNGWAVSPFTFGLNLTLKWRNFTLFAMGTGQTGAIGFKNSSYYWIKGNSKYSDVVWGRWTEENKDNALYPRLTTTDNSNNFQNSTFWMYKTNRFDLRKIQLTYDFPKSVLNNSFVNDLSLYVSGHDLLTISKERKLMEMNVGSAPQCRFFNIGLKASF